MPIITYRVHVVYMIVENTDKIEFLLYLIMTYIVVRTRFYFSAFNNNSQAWDEGGWLGD